MQKIAKYLLYFSIFLFYNLTTLYTTVVHDHEFSWTHEESCPAYIISVSHNSDTFAFNTDSILDFTNSDFLFPQNYDTILEYEIINTFSERAPPSFIC